jgi:uncharacterized protein
VVGEQTSFRSGDARCAAWPYHPSGAASCVLMAHGFGAVREAALARYAEQLAGAGHAVLVFDYRHFGASGGEPRQLLLVGRELADWRAAVEHARRLEGVDPARIALRGSSLSGGHVIATAADDPRIAAFVAQAPHTDGLATLLAAGLGDLARLTVAGLRDLARAALGRPPWLIPIVGPPGSLAAMNSPDAEPGYRAMFELGVGWRNEVSARSAAEVGRCFPGRRARRVRCPLLARSRPRTRSPRRGPPAGRRDGRRAASCGATRAGTSISTPASRSNVVSDQVEFLGRTL